MGLVKRAADLAYTFRFIRMLVMKWESWDAYKLGIIDANGKRDRNVKLDNDEKKSAYTPFIRLAANIKRLVSKVPGGGTGLGSFAAALYLIKEEYKLQDNQISDIIKKCGVNIDDILIEDNEWFMIENKQLSPGIYRVYNNKLLNKNFEEMVWEKDQIRIKDECYPVGDVLGIDVYEAVHMNTNQNIFITAGEIYR